MNKKLLSMLLALSMMMGTAALADGYTAGTYTGKADGRNGEITVDVTFSEDAITDIVVKDHQETAGISDAAINELPGEIVASQSLAVDAKSGATFTSEGLVNAVADAVAQAGGDADALRAVPVEKERSTETIEMTTDVVVVGGGAAGMAATVRLEQLGKNVILLEKASFLGGAISVSGGNQVVMGSKLQAEAGVTDDTVDSMVEDFMKNGANLNVPELLTLYAENVGATTDWLNEDCGIAFDMEGGLHQLGEYSHNRELAYVGGGAGFAETMRAAVEKSGEGKTTTRVALDVGKQRIKIYGKGSMLGAGCDKIVTYHPLTLPFGLRLPLTLADPAGRRT